MNVSSKDDDSVAVDIITCGILVFGTIVLSIIIIKYFQLGRLIQQKRPDKRLASISAFLGITTYGLSLFCSDQSKHYNNKHNNTLSDWNGPWHITSGFFWGCGSLCVDLFYLSLLSPLVECLWDNFSIILLTITFIDYFLQTDLIIVLILREFNQLSFETSARWLLILWSVEGITTITVQLCLWILLVILLKNSCNYRCCNCCQFGTRSQGFELVAVHRQQHRCGLCGAVIQIVVSGIGMGFTVWWYIMAFIMVLYWNTNNYGDGDDNQNYNDKLKKVQTHANQALAPECVANMICMIIISFITYTVEFWAFCKFTFYDCKIIDSETSELELEGETVTDTSKTCIYQDTSDSIPRRPHIEEGYQQDTYTGSPTPSLPLPLPCRFNCFSKL